LTVPDSTLSVNAATGFDFGGHHVPGRGGGIDNEGVATIQDSTLSGNSAEVGGGISNEAVGTLDVRGGTASDNTASDSGGAL
jgi:FAD/FMN-containing dehydrogenase